MFLVPGTMRRSCVDKTKLDNSVQQSVVISLTFYLYTGNFDLEANDHYVYVQFKDLYQFATEMHDVIIIVILILVFIQYLFIFCFLSTALFSYVT